MKSVVVPQILQGYVTDKAGLDRKTTFNISKNKWTVISQNTCRYVLVILVMPFL